MSRRARTVEAEGHVCYPLYPLIVRLNRSLRTLIPYRELYYKAGPKDYYIRIVSSNEAEHMQDIGPYHFNRLIALGDMLNLWTIPERAITNKAVIYQDKVYLPLPLPSHLQFPVVSGATQNAIRHLQAAGYTVILNTPSRGPQTAEFVLPKDTATVPLVTVAVTDMPDDGIYRGR